MEKKQDCKVKINGEYVNKTSRVYICPECLTKKSCKHDKHLFTSAENWVEMSDKYKYKIMGRYRLSRHIKKISNQRGEV